MRNPVRPEVGLILDKIQRPQFIACSESATAPQPSDPSTTSSSINVCSAVLSRRKDAKASETSSPRELQTGKIQRAQSGAVVQEV